MAISWGRSALCITGTDLLAGERAGRQAQSSGPLGWRPLDERRRRHGDDP